MAANLPVSRLTHSARDREPAASRARPARGLQRRAPSLTKPTQARAPKSRPASAAAHRVAPCASFRHR
eukprot:6186332-Pleurochrysis_carterae.AAC.1